MSDDNGPKDNVTEYKEKHVAPNFKRRELIFDSFAKMKHGTTSRATQGGGPKGGTLLYSWGAGYHGQLGNEAKRKKCEMIPVQINFNEPVIQVSCGGFHTAAVTEQGRVYTWGDGRYGQLGNLERDYNMHPTPNLVDELVSMHRATIVDLSCGQYHTCCVSAKGDLFSWGSAKYGQTGCGDKTDKRKPTKVSFNREIGYYAKVACGDKHTVALTTSKKVVTFGSGQHGQLGHGGETQSKKRNATTGLDILSPQLVKDLVGQEFKWIAAGATVSTAVTTSGEMWLWGFGESIHPKEYPNIVYNPRRVEFFVDRNEVVSQVGIGQSHVIVLTEGGDVWGFGNLYISRSATAGEAAVANVRTPRLILKRENIREIACGRYHTMCLSNQGVLFSWGIGESGQLGHNRLQSNEFPQIVDWIMPNVVGKIACGDHHSFCCSSIRFNDVHPDVKRWLGIQQKLLRERKGMRRDRKELSEGLRTKHVLELDQRRDVLVKQDEQAQAKSKEQQTKLLTVQLESIQMREQIEEMVRALKDTKKKVKKIRDREEEQVASKKTMQRKKAAKKKAGASASLTLTAGDGKSLEAEMVYQPLMPRIDFMEATQKALQDVKKQTDLFKHGTTVGKPNIRKFMRELFEQKKIFNKLCEDNKALLIKQQKLTKELSFMKPSDEDIAQEALNKKILDDLKMKLVTKDTQLMETEENRSNYNLYIIRMKEENLVISKSIDHLRQMVREYDRLITKLTKVCARVNGQRSHIQDEIGNFSKDIRDFSTFADEQLSRYRQMMNSNAKAKKMARQNQIEREAKNNQRKKRRLRKLVLEHEAKQKEAAAIEQKRIKFASRVDYFAQRMRKIEEATGLKDPSDIIKKFFANDTIAEDLIKDIKGKEARSKETERERERVVKDLEEKKAGFKLSKWRDITKQEKDMAENGKRVKKLIGEVEGINDRMLILKEGIQSLLASVQSVTGDEDEIEEDVEKALGQLRDKVAAAWDVTKSRVNELAEENEEA